MREVTIGTQEFTKITSVDDLEYNAYHQYYVSPVDRDPEGQFAEIKFQVGPIKEKGVNGCHNEDLLIIVADRLKCFQNSQFACRENAIAITKIEEALHWLRHRTDARKQRGVEGTSEI